MTAKNSGPLDNNVNNLDQQLRKLIAEYYMALRELNNREQAIDMLAEHVSIMVEMINEFKK